MTLRVINNLLDGAISMPSANHGPLGMQGILGIVWHWTGGIGKTEQYAKNLVHDIATANPQARHDASWHVLISRQGTIYQSVQFNRAAWHVGRPGMLRGIEFKNINTCTIGIELENAGDDPALPKERRVEVGASHFDSFPLAQCNAARDVLQALASQFKLTRDDCAYGHAMFDSARKRDPGPLWLEQILPKLLDTVF